MEMDHPETLGWLKDALAEETVGLRLHHHHLEWSWKRITTDSREAGEGLSLIHISEPTRH